jgi:hypothetical protein
VNGRKERCFVALQGASGIGLGKAEHQLIIDDDDGVRHTIGVERGAVDGERWHSGANSS